MKKSSDDIQDTEISQIMEKLQDIENTLKPIAQTYNTVTMLGKWGMAAMVFVSVAIGVLLGLKNLIHRS